MIEIRKTENFAKWIDALVDIRARARILVRIERLAVGNPGDVKAVGEGVSENKIYRSGLWQKPSLHDLMSLNIFEPLKKWRRILKLALKRRMVMPHLSQKRWAISHEPKACRKSRVMPVFPGKASIRHYLENDLPVLTRFLGSSVRSA